MIYSYQCPCGNVIDKECPMGKQPPNVKCPCGKKADRVYLFSVNVPNPTHSARQGRGKGRK